MKESCAFLVTVAVILSGLVTGCSPHSESGEHSGEHSKERRGEHDREGRGGHAREGGHEREGEESGTQLTLTQKYDKVRRGARLILAYDKATNSFNGTVENITKKPLKRVRVEVHLSNGKELGPTPAADLAPGQKRPVSLKATSMDFEKWSAHPEVGSGEHGSEHR